MNQKRKIKGKYQFKHLKLDLVGIKQISIVQSNYESLWNQVKRLSCTNLEKDRALERLKESCSWLCRGIAIYHEQEESITDE